MSGSRTGKGLPRGEAMERFTILTVCTGNVHRSPLAAVMLERWATWYLPGGVSPGVVVGSAGTRAPSGAPIGTRAGAIAQALGGDPRRHRARRLSDEMIAEADLILVASRSHRDDVLARVPSALRRSFTIREAGRAAEGLGRVRLTDGCDDFRRTVSALADRRQPPYDLDEDDIIDPQGLDVYAYARMVREEIPALATLAAVLFGMPPADLDEYRRVAADASALRMLDTVFPASV